jgi:hypothetical protein
LIRKRAELGGLKPSAHLPFELCHLPFEMFIRFSHSAGAKYAGRAGLAQSEVLGFSGPETSPNADLRSAPSGDSI